MDIFLNDRIGTLLDTILANTTWNIKVLIVQDDEMKGKYCGNKRIGEIYSALEFQELCDVTHIDYDLISQYERCFRPLSNGLYRVVADYQYVRYQYYIGISVWEGLFNKYKIDFCVVNGLLHGMTYDYLMFSVAQNRNISGFLMFDFGRGVRNMMIMYKEWGSELIDIPENERDSSVGDIVKQDAYYGSHRISGIYNDFNIKKIVNEFCYRCLGVGPSNLLQCVKKQSLNFEWYEGRKIKTYLPSFLYERLMWKYILRKNYKRYVYPNYKQKYVVYFMHMEPEATMVHYTTYMDSQLIAIKILADALPDDWELYVKEHPDTHRLNRAGWAHFIECYRNYNSSWYWHEISLIPKVKFINISESATKLIQFSQAVGTFSGTVIAECLNENKPCLIFGDSQKIVYAKIKGMYNIASYSDCCVAIKEISCGNWKGYDEINKVLETHIARNNDDGYKLFVKIIENSINQ